MKLTKSEVKQLILALRIVEHDKPLFSLDDNLQLTNEIPSMRGELEKQLIPMQGKRGNTKINIILNSELLTERLNKSLRYGIPYTFHIYNNKPITSFDKAVGIAIADKITMGKRTANKLGEL